MTLNAIGVYGFLSRAHIEQTVTGESVVSVKLADVQAKLDAKQEELDGINRRIDRGARVITQTTTGKEPVPAGLEQQQNELLNDLTDLRVERAKVEGGRKSIEADLGSVQYLATLLGLDVEQTMRWFILIVALSDPAAVLLLMTATSRRTA